MNFSRIFAKQHPTPPTGSSSTSLDLNTSSPPSTPTKIENKPKRSATGRPKRKKDQDTHPLNLPPEERNRLARMAAAAERPPTPMDIDSSPSSAPGAFPMSNGVDGDKENDSPRPPPHRSSTGGSMKVEDAGDAEASKAAGNKFFKAKQFDKAIAEYTKGTCFSIAHWLKSTLIIIQSSYYYRSGNGHISFQSGCSLHFCRAICRSPTGCAKGRSA